ncbi:hypothetical protein PIB30_112692, partial [Stylosanthes scabra]|nr:hypothetical protein [Stylosanthes scabra]
AWQPSPSSARIGVETTPRRGGPASSHKTTHMRDSDITKPPSSTHMRRSPRICVDSHSVHVHGHVDVTMTQLPTYRRTTSTHMRGRHIASMSSQSCSNMAPSPKTHAYAWKSTHMSGKLP